MSNSPRKPPPPTQRVQPCPSCGSQWELPRDDPGPGHSFCPSCRFPLMLLAHKYRLTQSLGSGTFGDVYLAQHIGLEQTPDRVVKVLKPEMFAKPEARMRFQREIQLTSVLSLQNEHIVRIFDDFGEIPGLGWFYVMEYLQGVTLGGLRKNPEKAPSIELICDIMCQLCDGMAAAHREQIVHRDLKPDNIFLIERHESPHFVKILDFGIAKPLNAIIDGSLTGQYRMLGTPLYMSPEQCLNSPLDHRSDIYAMGIILYELLTGRTPFFHRAAGGLTALIQAHVNEAPTPPQELRPQRQLPSALQDVALRAIEKAPERRFSSVQEMKGALLAATPSTSAVETLSWEEPTSRRATQPFTPQPLDAVLPTPDIQEAQAAEVAYLVDVDRSLSPPDVSLADADASPTTPERPAFRSSMATHDAPTKRGRPLHLLLLGLVCGGLAVLVWRGIPWQRVAVTHDDPARLGTSPQRRPARTRAHVGTATLSRRTTRPLAATRAHSARPLPSRRTTNKPRTEPKLQRRRRASPRPTLTRSAFVPRRSRLLPERPRVRRRRKRPRVRRARPLARRRTGPKGCPTSPGIRWIRVNVRPTGLIAQLGISGGIPSRLLRRRHSWFCLGFDGQARREVELTAPGFRPCRLTLRAKPPLIDLKLNATDNDALEQGSLDYCRHP